MKKILFSTIYIIFLMSNIAYAEPVKSSKSIKQSDSNKTMTNEEFMKRFMALDQKEKEAIKKSETLDEINKLLGVDKEK